MRGVQRSGTIKPVPRFTRVGELTRRYLTGYIAITAALTLACLILAIVELLVSLEIEHRIHAIKAYLWAIDTLLLVIGGAMLLAARRLAARQAVQNNILRANAEELRTLVSSAPVLTRVAQPDGASTFFNTPWLTFTGKPIDFANGSGWLRCIHEDDAERCERVLREHLESRTPFSMEYRLRRNDGVYRWMLDRGMPRFDSGGVFLGIISSCVDVTDRHDTEARVRELNEALENAVEGISTLDTNLRFASVNSAYARVLGAEPEELIGQPFVQTVHPADRQKLEDIARRLGREGKAEGELCGVRMDGTIFFQRITLVTRMSAQGEYLGSHAFMKDITVELRSRDVIAARERELADFFQNAMVGVCVLDTTGTIVDVNRANLNLLGYSREEFLGRKFKDCFTELPAMEAVMMRMARGERISDFETEIVCRDGTKKTVIMSWSGQFENGVFKGMRCITQDITERRVAESLATEHSMRFESLATITTVGIFLTDPMGRCLYVNDRWCNMAGIPLRSAMGDGWAAGLHPEDSARVYQSWKSSVEAGGEFRDEFRFLGPNRSVTHALAAASPVRDKSGAITGYVGSVTDITETKQSRDDLFKSLQTQLDLLQRERYLRQELDHRVRNNLASLMGLVSVYERSGRSTAELARTIHGKISAMVQVHETIARAQGRDVEIGTLLETLRASFIPGDSPTRFTLEGPRAVLTAAQASAFAMIVQELVTNSLKYGAVASGNGEITLHWNVLEKVENPGQSVLDLVWYEKGRPTGATIETKGSGVGLALIEGFARTDLCGSASFERGADDWRCHITAELSERTILNPPNQESNR